MKHIIRILPLFLLGFALQAAPVTYSGKVAINGLNYNGAGVFTFALRDANGTGHWRNGADSGDSINAPVERGRYFVQLGGQGMNPLPPNLFLDHPELYLQVHFFRPDTGQWLHLQPDQRIYSAPHALAAEVAKLADAVKPGAVSEGMLDPVLKAHLALVLKPAFSSPLADYVARPGQSVVLQAPSASGAYVAYQWKKDGAPIAGANGSQLTVSADADHQYSLVASNAFGSSETAMHALVARGGVQAIAAWGHTLYVDANGSLWAAGNNWHGKLGNGTDASRSDFLKVADGNVSAVGAGGRHSLYVKSDGSLWAIGRNIEGQLGDDNFSGRSTPVQVVESNVSAVAAGYDHSQFLKNDGSLWAMGKNEKGQLGDGTTKNRHSPVKVVDADVTAVAAGLGHTLYLKSNGSLWTMGLNNKGQLGDGTTTDRNASVRIVDSSEEHRLRLLAQLVHQDG